MKKRSKQPLIFLFCAIFAFAGILAACTAATHVVAFEPNGGTAVASQTVTDGEAAAKPADPMREGYAFAGWYTDPQFSAAYDFTAPVDADLTLYARWTENAVVPGPDDPGGNPGGDPEVPEKKDFLAAFTPTTASRCCRI